MPRAALFGGRRRGIPASLCLPLAQVQASGQGEQAAGGTALNDARPGAGGRHAARNCRTRVFCSPLAASPAA